MNIKISALAILSVTLYISGCTKTDNTAGPVTDIDGNIYRIIKIEGQELMAENLKATKFNDGSEIPLITDAAAWSELKTPGYCWYNNDASANKDTYGALYNNYAVGTGKLCPAGWHVPEFEEWRNLREFFGDSAKAGGKLKEAGTSHWLFPNKGADNSSGFTALPSGIRYFEGTFASILTYSSLWSSTKIAGDDSWCIGLYYAEAGLSIMHKSRKYGFSVRCFRDRKE